MWKAYGHYKNLVIRSPRNIVVMHSKRRWMIAVISLCAMLSYYRTDKLLAKHNLKIWTQNIWSKSAFTRQIYQIVVIIIIIIIMHRSKYDRVLTLLVMLSYSQNLCLVITHRLVSHYTTTRQPNPKRWSLTCECV